jgi:hypothetical protein
MRRILTTLALLFVFSLACTTLVPTQAPPPTAVVLEPTSTTADLPAPTDAPATAAPTTDAPGSTPESPPSATLPPSADLDPQITGQMDRSRSG